LAFIGKLAPATACKKRRLTAAEVSSFSWFLVAILAS
jgi:hypothetical protein